MLWALSNRRGAPDIRRIRCWAAVYSICTRWRRLKSLLLTGIRPRASNYTEYLLTRFNSLAIVGLCRRRLLLASNMQNSDKWITTGCEWGFRTQMRTNCGLCPVGSSYAINISIPLVVWSQQSWFMSDVFMPMLSPIHFLWSGDARGYMDITASEVRMISVACWTANESLATVHTRRTGETGWPTPCYRPCVSSRLARSLMYPLN
jgi:hypothetical protein